MGNAVRFHPGSTAEDATDSIGAIAAMQMGETELSFPLVEAASKIAFEEGVTFYDAVYLALAARNKVRLLTDDKKLFKKIGKRRELLQLLETY